MTYFGASSGLLKQIDCNIRHKPLYTQTYKSKNAEFHLNRKNIFDIIEAVDHYAVLQHLKARAKNLLPENSAVISYNGNKLELLAGVYDSSVSLKNHPVELEKVSLAELLVLQRDFIMKIKAHKNLVINPAELVKLARKYEL